jgi:hypothetical protein
MKNEPQESLETSAEQQCVHKKSFQKNFVGDNLISNRE